MPDKMVQPASPSLVCLDPGHVSDYSEGTQGTRISEASLNWAYALRLRDALGKLGYRVILTKNNRSERVTNRRRAEIANAANADLFVRLHADARVERGFAVYYPTRSGRAQDGATGPPLSVLKLSRRAAIPFHSALRDALRGKFPDFGLFGDEKTLVGSHQGALTGSIYARVPVLLVELGSLTDRNDEDFLLSPKGEKAMIAGLAEGVTAALLALK